MLNPVRVLVVDDERPARAKLARLLASIEGYELIGEALDGIEALGRIEALRPDLVILDIQMPGIDGFEVLKAIGRRREFAVIFVTAHEEHALRAFDAHAVDYLLKPFDGDRFRIALEKARPQIAALRAGNDVLAPLLVGIDMSRLRERLVVKTTTGWMQVPIKDIVSVSAADKHVWVNTREGRYLVRKALGAVEAYVDQRFVRVHRGQIVNVDAVVRLATWTHGDAILSLADGSTVVLTRTYRRTFLERFRPKK